MAADVVDENGKPMRNAVGELVIKAPWIGMTRGFWKDTQRYLDTYWSRWENIWVHGDFAAIDSDGHVVHPGSLGRHDQDRGQTAGARGGGIDPGHGIRPWSRRRRSASRMRSRAVSWFCSSVLKTGAESERWSAAGAAAAWS